MTFLKADQWLWGIVANLTQAIKKLFSFFFLLNWVEKGLFLLYMILFSSVQASHFRLLANSTRILGYDSLLLSWIQFPSHSIATVRHPLISVFTLPLSLLIDIPEKIFGGEYSIFLLYLFFDLIVAYAIVFVYRICNELIRLNQFRSILLAVLFSSFAHIIVQPFIIESYPITLLLLTMTLYVVGREIYLNDKSNPYLYAVLFVLTAGVTISNGLKTIIAILFSGGNLRLKLKWLVAVGLVFLVLSTIAYVATKQFAVNTTGATFLTKDLKDVARVENIQQSIDVRSKETGHKIGFMNFFRFDVDIFASIRGNVLGESILFHTADFRTDVGMGRNIYLEYKSSFLDWFIALFYCLVGLSISFSTRLKYVQVFLGFIAVDVFLHIICRFGMDEPYIYAAHWIFLLPLFLAYLYKHERLKNLSYLFDGLIAFFTGFCLYSNWSVFFKFLDTPV